ncbi:hypothetical protein [uncultured Adlercreutzia sp.]|uniref:hypothetical protein n=1 Tax=uncultured Adlercreutzia sp. TaxID=875803 RepID=UPI0026F3E81D|nr:hypothetical protein [uncultured Adlercreutzia sp.]
MLRRGEQRPFFRDRSRPAAPRPSAPTPVRFSFLGMVLRGMLAVILAVGLLPVVPATVGVEVAEAAVGTTDYDAYFERYDTHGAPTRPITNGVLRVASTQNAADYVQTSGNFCTRSDGCFVSRNPVSLKHDWVLRFKGQIPNPTRTSSIRLTNLGLTSGLCLTKNASVTNSVSLMLKKRIDTTKSDAVLQAQSPLLSSDQVLAAEVKMNWSGDSADLTLSYDCSADTLSMTCAGYSHKYVNVRKGFGGATVDSAYLYFGGQIVWYGSTGYTGPPSRNLTVSASFTSMDLPHFDPKIEGIQIYRGNETTPLKDTDTVPPGTIVRIECMVRNANASSAGEQFPVKFRMLGSSHAKYPTQGLTLIESTNPTTVNGTKATGTLGSSDGISFTLSGQTAAKVVYYARVNQSDGSAVKVGNQLVDGSFGSTLEDGRTLLSEKTLKPLPPDGGGAAGKDYHYSRTPQANANGWNNSSVAVEFFPGDFDRLTLTPGGGRLQR